MCQNHSSTTSRVLSCHGCYPPWAHILCQTSTCWRSLLTCELLTAAGSSWSCYPIRECWLSKCFTFNQSASGLAYPRLCWFVVKREGQLDDRFVEDLTQKDAVIGAGFKKRRVVQYLIKVWTPLPILRMYFFFFRGNTEEMILCYNKK